MKILIISSSHPYVVAGKVALFIKHDLEKKGHEVKLLTKFYDDFPKNGIITYYSKFETMLKTLKRKILNRLKKLFPPILKKVPKYAVQTFFQFFPFLNTNKILKLTEFQPDIIITLFMQGFINYIDLYHLQKKTKAQVFILSPDMAPFTGLCHFSYDCTKYQYTCGKCPAIKSANKFDISLLNFKSKVKYAELMKPIGIYWADNIGESMSESVIFRNEKVIKAKIPLELEHTYYQPVQEEIIELRKKLDISPDDFVISACAVSLSAERKGTKDIVEAVNILNQSNNDKRIVLLVAGKGNLPVRPSVKTINLGFLDKEELAVLFKVSDIFISASYADVGPETIPLSLACGVPVVSYKTGFAKEIIINNHNGFLIEVKDIKGISEKIQTYMSFSNAGVDKFKMNCIETASNFYNPNGKNSLESIIVKYSNKTEL